MKNLTIKTVTKDEFRKILLDNLVNTRKDWTVEDVFNFILDNGFSNLDFNYLEDSLKSMPVYLPTLAIDIGDKDFIWVVSGNKAMLVDKK